jgi:non-ribosomal peptide synthetase component F
MILVSALMILIMKYTRQEDILIGTPVANRTNKDTEHMLGMFVNTVVLRGKPEKHKRYIDFLNEIKYTCLDMYAHQEYPFDELVEAHKEFLPQFCKEEK